MLKIATYFKWCVSFNSEVSILWKERRTSYKVRGREGGRRRRRERERESVWYLHDLFDSLLIFMKTVLQIFNVKLE